MATAALIPDAATYGTQQAYATQAYQKAKSNIQNQQLGWLKQYGMTGDYNQNTNTFDNQHVDPYNQYGLIQQNRTSEAQDLSSAQDNAIGRGLGGSGLGNQMASNMRYQHGVQDTQLGNQFTQGMGQMSQGISDAADSYQQAMYQAENDAINRALQNQQFEQYSQLGNGSDGTDQSSGSDFSNGVDPVNNINWNDPKQLLQILNAPPQNWNKQTITDYNKANPNNKIKFPGTNVADTRKKVAANIAKTKGDSKAKLA